MELLTKRKVTARTSKVRKGLEYHLKDIHVNGELRGCSGHIVDPDTGNCVYVNTEHVPLLSERVLYRTAKDTRDYTGGRNRFCATWDLPVKIVETIEEGLV